MAGAPTAEEQQWRGAAGCPHRVAFPLMDQDWVDLSFLHWRYDADRVRQLLPAGVILDTFDGDAWVGIVPFLLRVRVPRGPVLPWIGVFPETNVRTYVRGPDGHAGIWFLSLDAPRRLAMWAARRMYSLPYHAAATRMRCDGPTRHYASWRTSGQHRGASSRARVSVGERIAESDVTPLEHFLTARWRLYAAVPGGIATARVEHEPWILRRAVATGVDARLVVAAGLPLPIGEPLVHAADDVHAAMSRLVRCRAGGGHVND